MHALAQSPTEFSSTHCSTFPVDQILRSVRAQDVLFFEDDDVTSIYEVVEGVFRTTKIHTDGRRQIPAFAFPGDLIGFGHGERYRFDCDALTPAKVRPISRHALLSAVKTRPVLAEKLLSAAADQIANMHDLSMILCRKSALERVASFLCAVHERTGARGLIRLPMSRSDIADHLGLTIETVSRNVSKLKQRDIIELANPSSIRVLDLRRLRHAAEEEDTVH
jgi:CRP-like cAMP-binding protein